MTANGAESGGVTEMVRSAHYGTRVRQLRICHNSAERQDFNGFQLGV